jgi:hypothetical protein
VETTVEESEKADLMVTVEARDNIAPCDTWTLRWE